MYGLSGLSANVKSVYRLAAPFIGSAKVKTIDDLRPYYLEFLNRRQSEFPLSAQDEQIVDTRPRALNLMGAFSASRINDLLQEKMVGDFFEGETKEMAVARVEEAMQAFQRLNPEAFELFRLVVHGILLCGSNLNAGGLKAHGGTSSKCVGLMWLSMKGGLSLQDVIELLVHETTHTLVFIDELNFGHFDYDELTKQENWARSSILNRLRPMDKVVHSIVVAHEVLYARATYLPNREALAVHPETSLLKANALAAIASVKTHPRRDLVCRPRALELVEKVEASLQNLKFSKEAPYVHAL